MHNGTEARLIQPAASLQSFFKERLEYAMEKHDMDRNDDTLWYLTRLLCDYSRTNRFLDANDTGATLTPLAEYYRMALESDSKQERRLLLQRLGDVAIIVSGLFAGALNKKAVGVDYYISMGEAAYGTLADESTRSSRERALQFIFETLSTEFNDYVVALSEVPTRQNHQQNLLDLVDEWQKNKHPAIAKELRQRGVLLAEEPDDHNSDFVLH